MATWDSPYLLKRFNAYTGRPSTDAISDPDKYQRLNEALQEIVGDIAAICPWVLYPKVAYGSMPTLTTTDNQVFTFGTDSNGALIAPIGLTGIYRDLHDIPDNPYTDYIDEGTQIRIPQDRTYTGTLYWRGITMPADMTAAQDPGLFPAPARELIAIRAAYNFCLEYNRNPDVAANMAVLYGRPLSANPGRFVYWCLSWQTQFRSGGALGTWSGLQMALAGLPNGIGS